MVSIINEKLARADNEVLPSKTDSEEIRKRLKIVSGIAGAWKMKESGREYVKKIRHGWDF